MIERRFEEKIKVIQSNGGKEFYFFITKLSFLGITHKITYPHSSTQNGTVESRNRRVVEGD